MRSWKLLPALIGISIVALIAIYVLFYFFFLDLFVDLWWFRSLDFEGYFWLRLLYRFILSGTVTLFFFGVFFFHFWIASRYLSFDIPEELLLDVNKRRRFQRLTDAFMSGSLKIYTPLSFILAFAIARPFYTHWEEAILYFFGRSSGTVDPVYGQDVSFYMLSYPIYAVIQQELLGAALIVFIMVALLYWLVHIFVPGQARSIPLGAKVHLAVLLGFVVLFVSWGFMLERYSLLYVNRHEPVYFGPGFVELRWYLPLIWLQMLSFIGATVAATFFLFRKSRRSLVASIVSLVLFGVGFGLKRVDAIPQLIDTLYVYPNPVKAQEDFMRYNIDATLDAYDLKRIKTVDFTMALDPTNDIKSWATQRHFENIPVWDREFLTDVYTQLQGIRPYYSFLDVDEDRYFIRGHKQQVNIAAREMSILKLPLEAQNWENKHLRYTHGYGAVVTPAAQDAARPLVWYMRDLNIHSPVGFTVDKPDIYYGLENYEYAVVPNNLEVVGISGSEPEQDQQYLGTSGIPIPSYFRKLLFAFYFRDEKIFFSTNITRESRMLMRRNIIDRIKTITPYLHLDKDPYLVVTKDRFYWIQDAYTLSKWYPVSKPAQENFLSGAQDFNYIRNAVKVVVDAYDGSVDYYIADPSDPIVKAYARAYPGLFKPLRKMPAELRGHLRYPRELFYLQLLVYAKYHQNTPALFYEQAETWQFPEVDNKLVMPYYITMDFDHCEGREEFVLVSPMTPVNRSNLSMVGIAGTLNNINCTPEYSPGITIYRMHKDVQVNGPAQVDALIDQNPEIAEQFSLWNLHGARVLLGRMIVLPMGNSMLYVQPVYMASTKTKIPELTRVIISIGNQAVMETTLRKAFDRLSTQFLQQNESANRLFGDAPLTPATSPAPPSVPETTP